jgi:Methylase involved in ubiquinone/menaquinone biosynthesis
VGNLKELIYTKLMGKDLYQSRINWTKRVLSELPEGINVLDAGAGNCKNKKFCPQVKYVSQDFCEYTTADETYKAPYEDFDNGIWDTTQIDIVSDIINIPVNNNSFDVIICTEVFEHLIRPELAIKEFARILNKGGRLIITAPANCGTHMAPYFYYNGLSRFWYETILEQYGFDIIDLTENGNYYDVIKERVLTTRVVAEEYDGIKMSLIFRAIGLIEGVILNYMSKKSINDNSKKYICMEYMCIAKKR